MADGVTEDSSGGGRRDWDERLLFAPLHTLSPRLKAAAVPVGVTLTLLWSGLLNGNLAASWKLPDVDFYLDMAKGHIDLVPQPFSARPLAPLIAHSVGALLHRPVESGFIVLAYVSLAWTAAVVFWLLTRTAAPRWMLLALAVLPFWQQLLGDVGLPDPLYAALIACLLVALEREWIVLAAGLMFPLMLARESTWLTLVCLLLVGWKRLGWAGSLLAIAGVVLGGVVVHRLSEGGLPNPEHISGGLYLVGKIVANLLRSVGVVPWSNVYPELCGTPAWQIGVHVGPVHSVGVCTWSVMGPRQAGASLLITFGILPVLLLLGSKHPAGMPSRTSLLFRFCLLYGGISFLIAPSLGTWYTRLFGYGWPLLLVAGPLWVRAAAWGEPRAGAGQRNRALWVLFLLIHLVVCAEGSRFIPVSTLLVLVGLEAVAVALVLVQRRPAKQAFPPV